MDKELFFRTLGLTVYEAKVLVSFMRLGKGNAKEFSLGCFGLLIFQVLREYKSL